MGLSFQHGPKGSMGGAVSSASFLSILHPCFQKRLSKSLANVDLTPGTTRSLGKGIAGRDGIC